MSLEIVASPLAMAFRLGDNGKQLIFPATPGEAKLVPSDEEKPARELTPLDPMLLSLLRRGQAGDQQAMEQIYERYKRTFFNLAYRYTYDRVEAEDLLQDIFIKIFTHLRDVDKEETFIAWMYRIAVNVCYSYLRSKRGRDRRTVALSSVEGREEEAVYDSHEKSLRLSLEEAIQELPDRLRAIFFLHDVQGFKHEEVAAILGIEVGTSKSQLFKARLRIRDFLKRKQAL